MIAQQNMQVSALLPDCREGQHSGAVGPAIHQITQQNGGGFGRRHCIPPRIVQFNRGGQRGQQIQPAMDVAYRINAPIGWNRGFALAIAGAQKLA